MAGFPIRKNLRMNQVIVYDRAMCCPTGVCGPQVDPVLPKFAADLEWLASLGHQVQRFNLAQDPTEFAKQDTVKQMLADEGVECLPLVLVDGRIVSRGEYPSREDFTSWVGEPTKPRSALPLADLGECSGNSGCC